VGVEPVFTGCKPIALVTKSRLLLLKENSKTTIKQQQKLQKNPEN